MRIGNTYVVYVHCTLYTEHGPVHDEPSKHEAFVDTDTLGLRVRNQTNNRINTQIVCMHHTNRSFKQFEVSLPPLYTYFVMCSRYFEH